MDPIVLSAMITTAGLIIVALIGLAQVFFLRQLNHNTNSMTERLEAFSNESGRLAGRKEVRDEDALTAANVETGRQQVKDEIAAGPPLPPGVPSEIDIKDVDAIKLKT